MSNIGYIGPPGGLAKIPCAPLTQVSGTRSHSEWETTEGVVTAQVGPKTRRQWTVDWAAATPEMIANLAAMFQGEYGYGPFWMVDPGAQATNVMSAEASMLSHIPRGGTIAGGPITLADGQRAGRSLVISDLGSINILPWVGNERESVPVVPGEPVCAYIYAAGPGVVSIRMSFWHAAGAIHSTTSWADFTTSAVTPGVIWRSVVVPEGADTVTIAVRGASRVARPGISWTERPPQWMPGQGAPSVLAPMEIDQALLLARSRGDMRSLRQWGSTIKEIG